jgi:hypothetical protein
MGYQDKDNKYLPPYNWWADSAAQHLIDVVNKYYKGTGFSFYLSQVRLQLCMGHSTDGNPGGNPLHVQLFTNPLESPSKIVQPASMHRAPQPPQVHSSCVKNTRLAVWKLCAAVTETVAFLLSIRAHIAEALLLKH